jgi:N-methylhydantoinase A
LTRLFCELESRALEQMARDGVPLEQVTLARTTEARYRGQGFELEVAVPIGTLGPEALDRVREAFHLVHELQYGYAMRDETVVLVNVQVTAIASLPKPGSAAPPAAANADGRSAPPLKDRRGMYLGGSWTSAAVYDRALLEPGMAIDGPALVEQTDSTTVLLPDDCGRLDSFGNLVIRVGGAA